MLVRSKASLVTTGDDRGTARRANRTGDKCIPVNRPLIRQTIDVRGSRYRFAIATQVRIKVFAEDPENVGFGVQSLRFTV